MDWKKINDLPETDLQGYLEAENFPDREDDWFSLDGKAVAE